MKRSAAYYLRFLLYVLFLFSVLWMVTPASKTKYYKPKLSEIPNYTYIDENNVCYKYKVNEISS